MLLKREFIFPHNFLDHLIKLTKKKKNLDEKVHVDVYLIRL